MQNRYGTDKNAPGAFRTAARGGQYARMAASARQHSSPTIEAQEEVRWRAFFRRAEEAVLGSRGLWRRTAACLLLVLGILGVKALGSKTAQQFLGDAASVLQSTTVEDEELGRLHFVNGTATDGAYSLPLEGEVVQSFAESEREVSIQSEQHAEVKAILAGTVIKTSQDSVVVNNANGTQTTYTGLKPTVLAGDAVQSAQVIGSLHEEVLCLETVSGIGYVDSLDAAQLREAAGTIES